jgi:hypothetical protein
MKKKLLVILVIFLISLLVYSLFAQKEKFVQKDQKVINCKDCLVKNEETAVRIAEDNLFSIYGKTKIEKERPYNIKLINNKIWLITGSLNKGLLVNLIYLNVPKFGGTFEIKISAQNGKIIDVIHYK